MKLPEINKFGCFMLFLFFTTTILHGELHGGNNITSKYGIPTFVHYSLLNIFGSVSAVNIMNGGRLSAGQRVGTTETDNAQNFLFLQSGDLGDAMVYLSERMRPQTHSPSGCSISVVCWTPYTTFLDIYHANPTIIPATWCLVSSEFPRPPGTPLCKKEFTLWPHDQIEIHTLIARYLRDRNVFASISTYDPKGDKKHRGIVHEWQETMTCHIDGNVDTPTMDVGVRVCEIPGLQTTVTYYEPKHRSQINFYNLEIPVKLLTGRVEELLRQYAIAIVGKAVRVQ